MQGNCAIIDHLDPPANGTLSYSPRCPYPSYYSYIGVLAQIVISMPTYISYLRKLFLMSALSAAQCWLNLFVLPPSLDREDSATTPPGTPIIPLRVWLSENLIAVTVTLTIVARYVSVVFDFLLSHRRVATC